jgi:hypothetical protein
VSSKNERSPQQQIAATGCFRCFFCLRQSRKATFFIAFDRPSVFIKTGCQPFSVVVAQEGRLAFGVFTRCRSTWAASSPDP